MVERQGQQGLGPGASAIICVGEKVMEDPAGGRARGRSPSTRSTGSSPVLRPDAVPRLVIACRASRAIGTGEESRRPADAQEVCAAMSLASFSEVYGPEVGAATRILYGG